MHAFRSLLKAPGFTAVAVLTLALGLGANTAIFSAVYSVLLKPLPFADSDRLMFVRAMVQRDTWERRNFSSPDLRDYAARVTQTLEGFSGHSTINFNVTGDGEAARVTGERVGHGYFAALGVQPVLGRTFTAEEDNAPELPPLAVLSHDLWRTRYASDPALLGRTIRLNEVGYTVIGVMPPAFRGLDGSRQLWVPMSTLSTSQWNARGNRGLDAIARLRPGVSIEQARAELAAAGLELARNFPDTNARYSADLVPLREELLGDLRRPLLVLFAAVALVLLITCANVANLLLVRLATRRREIAIRISLGASRGALARLCLGESTALALAGGAGGLLLATWLVAALGRWAPVELPRFVSFELHLPAFAFAAAVTLFAALLIGVLPALLAGRQDLNASLKDAGRTGTSASGGRIRAALIGAEIALSLALLVASGLFVRSFINLVTQPAGFRTERVVSQRVTLPAQRYNRDAIKQFARTLQERAAALPGVKSVALSSDTPLDGNWSATFFSVEGRAPPPAANEGRAYVHTVSNTFFETAGLTVLRGETFAPSYAAESEIVVLVSENLARRFWPDGEALGQRLKAGRSDSSNPWMRIIGIVAEAKYRGLVSNVTHDPDIYGSIEQRPTNAFALLAQTTGESRSLGHAVRQLVATLDPNVPVFGVATIEERIARASAGQRFTAQLMGGFASVALLLAAIGLYGVVSFSVGQRTQEIGVRMALGARPADIARLILGGTGKLVLLGLGAGAALSLLFARFIAGLLFQVNPYDPLTYGGVAAILALVALLAAWLPTRRAARVDPMTALRAE